MPKAIMHHVHADMIPATEGLCAAVGGTFTKFLDGDGRYTAICNHPVDDPAGVPDMASVMAPVASPILSVVPDGPPSAAYLQHSSDLALLHPAVRRKVVAVQQDLVACAIPFRMFETFRSPHRQAARFAQGRGLPGRRVTHAAPWASFHQFGLAADFARFDVDGWARGAGTPQARRDWEAFQSIARDRGLLPINCPKPHVQLRGVTLRDLMNGAYPAGGDASWANNLADAIRGWQIKGGPPKPTAPVCDTTA
ncbi:M15 family metallopeptidase [uncultured Tateyamaria sp.]|uniref:M15 family metallopeptidase n=1 Tax=uncultured Tateyamaria sp. TaxID=455651 RepID=UPI0026051226|nr:M15 family metallopeptidase [uncultured Tateyamaria sp.]